MHLGNYLMMLQQSERNLADGFARVGAHHGAEPDIADLCATMEGECRTHADGLQPYIDRYQGRAPEAPENLMSDLFQGTRAGGIGLLRDLHDLYVMASEVDISWTVIGQAAQGAKDKELLGAVQAAEKQTKRQLAWLRTRMNQAAPQSLLVSA